MTQPTNNSTPLGASLLSEQQDHHFLLMRRRMNNVQACRAVGISRKTGKRWRLGRTEHKNGHRRTYAPVGTSAIPPISSRYLSEPERVRIADLRRLGWTIRAIATDLGRAPSTVSRDLGEALGSVDGKVGTLGEVLTKDAVHVLVRATFPRRMRVAEIHRRAGDGGDFSVQGHFSALIPGDRETQVRGDCTQRWDERLSQGGGGARAGQMHQQQEPAGALNEGGDRGAAVLSDDEVAFPVAGHGAVVDIGRW